MASTTFTVANLAEHRELLLQLNVEYMSWALAEVGKIIGATPAAIVGMSPADYVASVIDKVCGEGPPKGVFYLVWSNGELAGMGGLRWVRDGVAELKRIYVRPSQRGKHLGEATVRRLLDDAKAFGYSRILLDSGPYMQSAHRVYEAFGFTDCSPYLEAEVPLAFHAMWRFMERAV